MAKRREPSPAERAGYQLGFQRGYGGSGKEPKIERHWEPFFLVGDDGEITLVEETTIIERD